MSRILSALFGVVILVGAISAQDYKPEPVSISKNVLKAYDRFHDRTTVMLRSFPVTAVVGKDHYLLSMTAGFMFDTKMPSKKTGVDIAVLQGNFLVVDCRRGVIRRGTPSDCRRKFISQPSV